MSSDKMRILPGENKSRTNPYHLVSEDVKILAVDGDKTRKYVAVLHLELGGRKGKVSSEYHEILPITDIQDTFIRNEITARCIREAKRQLMTVREKLDD